VRGLGHNFSRFVVLAGFTACVTAPTSPATAGEVSYCVTCKGPDQTYLCKVVGESSRPNDALKLYCIVRTAKEGNHASCRAKRDIEGCVGEPKVFSYEGPTIPAEIASDPRAKKIMGRLAHEQQKFAKPEGEGPQTLVDLTSRAVKSSRKGLRNAREAISGPSDDVEASSETTASTPPLPQTSTPPPPHVSAPAPQGSAAPQVLTPAPQASVTQPEALPQAAPAPEPSRMRRMKNAAYNAGAAVGGFARKSYSCMWSLLRNCGSESQSTE
jgi:hypothetical protein